MSHRIAIPTPDQAAEYVGRLARVVDQFARLGFGTRQRAAFDLRIPPSRLSGVLNNREVNADILARADEWSAAELKRKDRGGS